MKMPTTVAEAQRVLSKIAQSESKASLARLLGTSPKSISRREKRAKKILEQSQTVIPPALASDELPTDELIDRVCADFKRRKRAHESKDWMEFGINTDEPVCLVFLGDSHVDDNGCNWPLLKEHAELISQTEGMYSVPLGDFTNNWIGRLSSKIYPHQSTTFKQGWQLAEWLINKIDPLVIIGGNHDMWSKAKGGVDPLEYIAQGKIKMDWQAKFQIKFKNDRVVKIWAAHDFKGNSMWNPLHGPMKKEQLSGSIADIYAAGDKHNWIITRYENATTGKNSLMLRARGYKFIDEYSEQLGFDPQQHGASIAVIIDPKDTGPDSIQPFADLDLARRYLEFKRQDGGKINAKGIFT